MINYFGAKNVTMFVIFLESILISTLFYVDHIILYGFWIVMLNFCEGGLFVCYITLVLDEFGIEKGTKTYPLVINSLILTFGGIYLFDNIIVGYIGY